MADIDIMQPAAIVRDICDCCAWILDRDAWVWAFAALASTVRRWRSCRLAARGLRMEVVRGAALTAAPRLASSLQG
jgi:hypothetical protein